MESIKIETCHMAEHHRERWVFGKLTYVARCYAEAGLPPRWFIFVFFYAQLLTAVLLRTAV